MNASYLVCSLGQYYKHFCDSAVMLVAYICKYLIKIIQIYLTLCSVKMFRNIGIFKIFLTIKRFMTEVNLG